MSSLNVAVVLVLSLAVVDNSARADSPWSPKAAAKYLDERADWWLNWSSSSRGQGTHCVSCHTAVPYALARQALGGLLGETEAGAVEHRLIDSVRKRVANWATIVAAPAAGADPFVPFYRGTRTQASHGTEAVLNALVLVNHDVRRGKGILSPQAKQALDHMWGQQKVDGAWRWLDFGLRPWETDGEFYGASLAALAVGSAGPTYYTGAAVGPKVTDLKTYLTDAHAKQSLHNRTVALWASSYLPDALPAETKKALITELLAAQEPDGGWSLPKLGAVAGKNEWKSHGAFPTTTVSDGYATGLVVLALKRGGVSAEDARLKKAVQWLAGKQKDGVWPVHYLNKDRNPQSDVGKFMRDAAAAYAVLALSEP